jgi:hypothetical protein
LTNSVPGLKDPRKGVLAMSDEVQGREETKLANGGGAFPFWVSVVIVVAFVTILFSAFYGLVRLFS